MIHSLSAEAQLALCCARTRLGPAHADRIGELLAQPIDRAKLLACAEAHGLLPLVATHLGARADTPGEWQEPLRNRLRDAQVRGLHLTGVLLRVLDALRDGGISALTYKGPALAQALYGNLALRPFSDVDILVPHAEVHRSQEILLREGYVSDSPAVAGKGHHTAGQFLFHDARGEALVELHTERTLRHFPRPLPAEWLFASPEPVVVAGREVPTLSPPKLLIALAVHGTKDLWEQWKWVVDIAEFLRVYETLDWSALFDEARRMGCEQMLGLALSLARQLLHADVPAPAAQHLQANVRASAAAEEMASRLIRQAAAGTGFSAPGRFFLRMRACSGSWEGFRYALRLATTPAEEDYSGAHLPAPLYPLLRPFRLLRKYGIR